MDKIKVLLFTMTGFGNEVIKSLYNNPLCELIGVVVPKRLDTPYPYYECKPLHEEVSAIGVQLYEGLNLKDKAHIDFVISLKPDLILVATFNQILPKNVLKMPVFGSINLHPSLLPKYRGASPTTWAIYHGERQTGITAHVLTEDIDKGDIIFKRVIDIDINDTDGTLRKKLSVMAGNMAKELIEIIHNGTMNKTSQDERCATHYPKRAKTCLILSNLTDNPLTIHNKIRSHLPYPGVQILQGGGIYQSMRHITLNVLEY